ncbi:hypothetical protein RND71_036728 [Anisodus tanguticus]|uniref:Uncharacterized protein n=1 Tax=Anisodus tanguticus TaxID=243964 RepID=A0AAE1R120_9SOLA|nr:hypothetical protein RND71_036728 [Anisodus tanguticus]
MKTCPQADDAIHYEDDTVAAQAHDETSPEDDTVAAVIDNILPVDTLASFEQPTAIEQKDDSYLKSEFMEQTIDWVPEVGSIRLGDIPTPIWKTNSNA